MAERPTREELLSAIQGFANGQSGSPSKAKFFEATGFSESQIVYYWPKWSDAVRDAGVRPNERAVATPQSDDLARMKVAHFAVELGRVPTRTEVRLARRNGSDVPGGGTFQRLFGGKDIARELAGLAEMVPGLEAILGSTQDPDEGHTPPKGWVYLMRSGSAFKIGATVDVLRREGELQLAVPGGVEPIHTIETDDPFGIEAYWHRRFADRRINGEWFDLTKADVAAFRSRGTSM